MPHSPAQLKRFARHMRNNPTDAERKLWYHLRMRRLDGHQFLRQKVIDGAIVDFVCRKAKLIIELDGGQHDLNKAADDQRTRRLNQAGYHVLRFWNNEIQSDIYPALQTIRHHLNNRTKP